MNKVYIILLLVLIHFTSIKVQGQTNRNFVKTTVLLKDGKKTQSDVELSPAADKLITYEYQDGFARPIQTISVKGSPLGYDIVLPIEYDNYGRKSKSYLPYVSDSQTGAYREDQFNEQASFYVNSNNKIARSTQPFSIAKYDDSPFQKLLEQGSPGEDWQPGIGHTNRKEVSVNSVNDHVKIYSLDGIVGEYNVSALLKVKVIDENNQEIIYFSDKNGKRLLKRAQLDINITENGQSNFVSYLDTYYVYDDSDNIILQIPPRAAAKVAVNPSIWNQQFIDNNLFIYKYDVLNRIVSKKAPDALAVYICYDQYDRPAFIQDGNLRVQNKWLYTKYDLANRVVIRGIYTYQDLAVEGDTQQEKLQRYLKQLDLVAFPESGYEERITGTEHGYTNQTFPSSSDQIISVYYYDDYDFDNNGIADYGYTSQGMAGEEANIQGSAFGQLTGVKNLVLGTQSWVINIPFYDRDGKRIQLRSNNHLSSAPDNLNTTVYNFSNQVKASKTFHKAGPNKETSILNRYDYDHVGRLIAFYQNNNSTYEQLIARYEYNEIGQLIDKKLHDKGNGSFLQSIDFRYNIRGWLTHINNSSLTADGITNDETDDLFGMEFLYNTQLVGLTNQSGTPVNWNGNITAVKWKTQASTTSTQNGNAVRERSYVFKYDKLNRLLNASYQAFDVGQWSAEQGGYNESVAYDHNGNITSLRRYMLDNGSTTPKLIDDLEFAYNENGNQLKKVEDASGDLGGFKNLVNNPIEYAFDENGNTSRDENKGVSQIKYNEINKVQEILFVDGRKITYQYTSDGTRISKSVYQSGSGLPYNTVDYVSGFVYENGALSYFSMPEGRVRKSGSDLLYEYFIKDNLGNTRVSFEAIKVGELTTVKLTQENHYYPFGLSMKGMAIQVSYPSAANKNLYNNGSELQDDFGDDPNTYSTFYRDYDPALARMLSVDPLTEKYGSWSPYNYSFNNPISFNDPTGAEPYNWRDPYGYGDEYTKGWNGGFDDGNSSSSSGYGETFDDLINKQFGGNPWAMINYFWNQSPSGSDYHYVPTADGFASAKMYGFSSSDGITTYVVGTYNEYDSQGNSMVRNGVSGEFTAVIIDNNDSGRGTTYQSVNNKDQSRTDEFWNGFLDNGSKSNFAATSTFIGEAGLLTASTESLLRTTARAATTWADKAYVLKSVKGAARTGQALGIIGVLATVGEDWQRPQGLTWGTGVKSVILGAGVIFPVFGVVYCIVDLGWGVTTGKTLTDRIGDGVDSAIGH